MRPQNQLSEKQLVFRPFGALIVLGILFGAWKVVLPILIVLAVLAVITKVLPRLVQKRWQDGTRW